VPRFGRRVGAVAEGVAREVSVQQGKFNRHQMLYGYYPYALTYQSDQVYIIRIRLLAEPS
jgi:hypothetical protein